MKQIILKDLSQQRFILLVGSGLLLLTFIIPRSEHLILLSLSHFVIPLLAIVVGVLVTESNEEKNYGYTLLSTLPISRMGVISAKFLYLLGESILFGGVSLVVLSINNFSDLMSVNPFVLLAVSFTLYLSIGAISLTGIYVLGLKNFTRAMLVLMIAVQIVVFLMGVQRYKGLDGTQKILEFFSYVIHFHPLIIIGGGILVWGLLLSFSSQFRKRI